MVSAIGVNYVSTSATRDMSEIELANVEALAGDENAGGSEISGSHPAVRRVKRMYHQ